VTGWTATGISRQLGFPERAFGQFERALDAVLEFAAAVRRKPNLVTRYSPFADNALIKSALIEINAFADGEFVIWHEGLPTMRQRTNTDRPPNRGLSVPFGTSGNTRRRPATRPPIAALTVCKFIPGDL
jgi:hypothetical protein